MSNSEVLTPILLRSSTPAPSEKGTDTLHQPVPRPPSDHRTPVLLYLEGIQRSGGASPVRDSMMSETDRTIDPNDPRFERLQQAASQRRSSGLSKQAYNANDGDPHELGNSDGSYEFVHNDDAASNVQDGVHSEVARSERGVSMHDAQEHHNEAVGDDVPGPNYGPGSPSFGNMGRPREAFGPPQSQPTQPAWYARGTPRGSNTGLPLESGIMSPGSRHKAPWGQTMLRPTNEASAMTPKTTDINIEIQPPSDPSRQGTRQHSRAPSRQSRQSSGGRHDVISSPPSQPQVQQVPQQQIPGITVNINADGSTTISIPRSPPANEVPSSERAQTERAISEVPDEMRSPKARSLKPASVAASRRPSGGETDQALFSPGVQSRTLKSPRPMSKAPSKAASRAASQMSPVDAFRPLNGFQSFAMPEPTYAGQEAPPQRAQSTRAHSHIPATSQKEPSEVDTIPNEPGSSAEYYRDDPAVPSARAEYGYARYANERANGYSIGGMRPGASMFSGSAQRGPVPLPLPPHMQNHSRPAESLDSRNTRPKMQTLSPVPSAPATLRTEGDDPLATPTQTQTQTRPVSPEGQELNDYETEIVQGILNARTPRTSIAPSILAEEIKRSNYHDEHLCILLHAADDPTQHEIVKKALRKAVAARIRKLGLKGDKESIRAYRKQFHDHDPSWHVKHGPTYNPDDPPAWAKEMMEQLQAMENRVAALGPQIAQLKKSDGSRTRTHSNTHRTRGAPTTETQDDEWERTPRTQTIPIGTQMTGADSTLRQPGTDYTAHGDESYGQRAAGTVQDEFEDDEAQGPNGRVPAYTDHTPTQPATYRSSYGPKRGELLSSTGRGESPGQQILEEELYRLRVKDQTRSAAMTHQSWELHQESVDGRQESHAEETEIPDVEEDAPRAESPPLPPVPAESQSAANHGVNADRTTSANNERQWEYHEMPPTPPWQRIHQRLLNWAIVWPMSELDNALASTQRGNQVDEVALSIWCTQMYKRYVRQQLTEVPPGRVDRLFVPPNMADAINNAVFHGRHGDACGMLRDLWTPFGLEGMPRIILVLCKHRSDPNHWVAHKFSLPDGTLTTYDTFPEKSLPDGRPLGWWFAIRIAWPSAMYPSPDNLMQKMVRLHRPMQLAIDNSVAAAGIWRNLLMGSRAERPVDLERLRDLINTEVKNLRQRKEQGKLSVAAAVQRNWNWDDMGS